MPITNLYIGKLNSTIYLYLDPIEFNIDKLFNNVQNIHCNSVIFDGLNCKEIVNQNLKIKEFNEILEENNSLYEFDMILNHNIHVQNIWWNDLLIIAEIDSFQTFLNSNKESFSLSYDMIMNNMKKANNKLVISYDDKTTKISMNPTDFISYMKNSDRYLHKEFKFLHNPGNFSMADL